MQHKLLALYSEFYIDIRDKHPINIKIAVYDAVLRSYSKKNLSQGQNL